MALRCCASSRTRGYRVARRARPAFQAALQFCNLERPDFFIVWSTSRFARNKLDSALTKRDLRKDGTRVVYVSVDIDSETDAGWLVESMSEIFDEMTSRTISKDTKRSMTSNARNGYWNGGRLPFGYRVAPDGKRSRLEIDENEAPTVEFIFDSYLSGQGVKAIAMSLNSSGRYKRGQTWTKNTVTALLRNPVVAGFVVFNRTSGADRIPIPEDQWITTKSHPALIDYERFERVQQTFGERAPELRGGWARGRFVFSGILKCGACGGSMQSESATGRSKTYFYYNCLKALKGSGCENRRIPAEEFDAWMLGELTSRLFTRDRVEQLIADMDLAKKRAVNVTAERRGQLETDLRAHKVRRGNIFDLLEQHGKETPNLPDVTVRLRELNDQIKVMERQLAQLDQLCESPPRPTVPDVENVTKFLRSIFDRAQDPKKLREFFLGFVDGIVLDGDAATIRYRPDRIIAPEPNVVQLIRRWLPDQALTRTASFTLALPDRFRKAA